MGLAAGFHKEKSILLIKEPEEEGAELKAVGMGERVVKTEGRSRPTGQADILWRRVIPKLNLLKYSVYYGG